MSASVSLPILTGGVGAAVPTDTLGSLKTLIATGVDGVVEVEASGDGVNFLPVTTFQRGQAEQIISLVCAAMRVNAANGSANSVAVMAEEAVTECLVIPSPPTNGPGPSVNVKGLGFLTSVLVTQPSGGGTVEIQISEDNVNWQTTYKSVQFAMILNAPALSGNFMRAVGNQATAASISVCSALSEGQDANLFAPKFPAPFTTPPQFNFIYARLTGSDASGDGSLANPYRTFQRAIQDVPLNIPTGVYYKVDITGIGVEILPPDYVIPKFNAEGIMAPGLFPLSLSFNELPLTIQADPQIATMSNAAVPVPIPPAEANVNLADFTITTDQVTGRPTLTLNVGTRPSWANDGMKGKIFRSLAIDDIFATASVIAGSTDTTLTLVSSPPLFFGLGGPFEIQNCSATLQSSGAYGLDCSADTYLLWTGINFTSTDPSNSGLSCSDSTDLFYLFCEFPGIFIDSPKILSITGCYWHGNAYNALLADFVLLERCLMADIGFWLFNGSIASLGIYAATIKNCAPITYNPIYFSSEGFSAANGLFLLGVNIEGSAGDAFTFYGSAAKLVDTRIDDCAGNGLTFLGAGRVVLENVVGDGNAGFGVVVDSNGAQVVADPLTTLTGASGDASVGSVGAVPWSAIVGSGDSLAGPVGPTMTLTDAAGLFTAGMVGKLLHLSAVPYQYGTPTAPNNGAFLITAFIDAQNIEYTDPAGVAGPFLGNWAVLDPAGANPYNVPDFTGPAATGSRLVQVA